MQFSEIIARNEFPTELLSPVITGPPTIHLGNQYSATSTGLYRIPGAYVENFQPEDRQYHHDCAITPSNDATELDARRQVDAISRDSCTTFRNRCSSRRFRGRGNGTRPIRATTIDASDSNREQCFAIRTLVVQRTRRSLLRRGFRGTTINFAAVSLRFAETLSFFELPYSVLVIVISSRNEVLQRNVQTKHLCSSVRPSLLVACFPKLSSVPYRKTVN